MPPSSMRRRFTRRRHRAVLPNPKERPSGVASQNLSTDVYFLKEKIDGELGYGETAEHFLTETQRTLDAHTPAPFELALVMSEFVKPTQTDDHSFRGGYTTG